MTLIDALKSGRPFRRKVWNKIQDHWFICKDGWIGTECGLTHDWSHAEDLLATDYELAPQKAREWTIACDEPKSMGCISSYRAQCVLIPAQMFDGERVKVREVLPGEVVVTREKLAKAWDYARDNNLGSIFDTLCRALGLGE